MTRGDVENEEKGFLNLFPIFLHFEEKRWTSPSSAKKKIGPIGHEEKVLTVKIR